MKKLEMKDMIKTLIRDRVAIVSWYRKFKHCSGCKQLKNFDCIKYSYGMKYGCCCHIRETRK